MSDVMSHARAAVNGGAGGRKERPPGNRAAAPERWAGREGGRSDGQRSARRRQANPRATGEGVFLSLDPSTRVPWALGTPLVGRRRTGWTNRYCACSSTQGESGCEPGFLSLVNDPVQNSFSPLHARV